MFANLILFIAFLFAAGCAPYLVVSDGQINPDKLQEIKAAVARLRGLPFKADVAVEVKNSAEMRRAFESDLEQDYGDEKLRNVALAYAKLGLLPKGTDLKKSLVDFATAEVAAYYDPRAKKLVMPQSMNTGAAISTAQFVARRDFAGEMVLAHELTHALQDQHFSLEARLGPSGNDDADLAFRALTEGDATLSGWAYLSGRVELKALERMSQGTQQGANDARSLVDVPPAIVEETMFQYTGGVAFVFRLLRERDWAAVNRIYAAPPLSTEQVLHPEKYFSHPDPPTKIRLDNLPALFSPDWKELENNVLGELMVQVLFKQFFSENEAKTAAEGWDGDRFVAFRRGDEVAFVWASVWDSEQDAEEFEQGYRRIVAKKYPDGRYAEVFYAERRGPRVVIVEGLPGDRVKRQIEMIWQGMEITEEPFNPPFAPSAPAAVKQISP